MDCGILFRTHCRLCDAPSYIPCKLHWAVADCAWCCVCRFNHMSLVQKMPMLCLFRVNCTDGNYVMLIYTWCGFCVVGNRVSGNSDLIHHAAVNASLGLGAL